MSLGHEQRLELRIAVSDHLKNKLPFFRRAELYREFYREQPTATPTPAARAKRCFGCKEELPLEEFNKSKDHKDGHAGRCKICARDLARKRYPAQYARQAEHRRAYAREYARRRQGAL